MHHDHARPADRSRIWRTADAIHIDLRGLESPEPMVTVLQTIESGDVDTALVGHFDQEPIFSIRNLKSAAGTTRPSSRIAATARVASCCAWCAGANKPRRAFRYIVLHRRAALRR